jgi:hypothetical protein
LHCCRDRLGEFQTTVVIHNQSMRGQAFIGRATTASLQLITLERVLIEPAQEKLGKGHRAVERGRRSPQILAQFDRPNALVARVVLVHVQPAVMHAARQFVRLLFGQFLRTGPQVLPLRFERGERLRLTKFCFGWIARPEAPPHFAPPDCGAERVRDTLAQPIKAGLRMLPRTCHCQCHVYHPCVPLGRSQPADVTGSPCSSRISGGPGAQERTRTSTPRGAST